MVNRDAAFSDCVPTLPAHRPEHDLTAEVTSLEVVHAPTPHPIQRREFTNPDELCNRATEAPFAYISARTYVTSPNNVSAPIPSTHKHSLPGRSPPRDRPSLSPRSSGYTTSTHALKRRIPIPLVSGCAPCRPQLRILCSDVTPFPCISRIQQPPGGSSRSRSRSSERFTPPTRSKA